MIRKLMKRVALLGMAAIALSACFDKNGLTSQYESNLLVHYEPDYASDQASFMDQFFNGGEDTVSVNQYLSFGPLTHVSTVEEDGSLVGGFAMCIGRDGDASPERKPSYFAVYGTGGNDDTYGYVVFHDTLATRMPEHLLYFNVPNEASSCTMNYVYVNNVQAVVQAVLHGNGLSGGPFEASDYLSLTITGYKGDKVTGSVTAKLVDGTKPLDKWTEVSLSSLGSVEMMDFHLEASRPDLPLYCCLDDLYFHYLEIY